VSEGEGLPLPGKGGQPTRVEVAGVGFHWTGVLTWGHAPYGTEPIAWTCELCWALTVDVSGHARWHAVTDMKEE
jgi:hypothetical protein